MGLNVSPVLTVRIAPERDDFPNPNEVSSPRKCLLASALRCLRISGSWVGLRVATHTQS
jgi:hypothetical protein